MTNEDLFLAITHARPGYLDHSEQSPPVRRRKVPRLAMIAAIAAMLTFSALAVPYIRDALQNGYRRETAVPGVITDLRGRTHVHTGMIDVHVDLDLEEDRPESIEQAFVPMYFVENWEPVTKLRSASQAERTERINLWLSWQRDDGQTAIFQQNRIDNSFAPDTRGFELHSVNTGYNTGIEPEEITVGDYTVYRVLVPPSSLEHGGKIYSDGGRRVYLWSDGVYYYVLELSWETDETVAELALSSMEPVALEEISEYESVEIREQPTYVPGEPRDTVLYPTWLPEHWRRSWASLNPDGFYEFWWDRKLPEHTHTSTLQLYQDNDGMAGQLREWEIGLYKGAEKTTMTIHDWDVIIYQNRTYICGFWNAGEEDYMLKCGSLEDRMDLDTFVKIIENMEVAEEPQTLLKNPDPGAVLYPEYLPEGWKYLRGEEEDGYYTLTWQHQQEDRPIFSQLFLTQVEHGYQMNAWNRTWSGPDKGTKEELSIGDWEVTLWYNDTRIEAFWFIGHVDYVLTSTGENRMNREDFLQVLESMAPADNPAELITN